MNSDEYSSYYLRSRGVLGSIYRKLLLFPVLQSLLRGRVLDVGCASGDFLSSTPRSVGLDINPTFVALCAQRGLPAYLFDGKTFPFLDASFDSVLLDNVLEHIADPAIILSESVRVLSVGGLMIIGVPSARGFREDPTHIVFYDEKSLTNLCLQFGFKFKEFRYTPINFRSRYLSNHVKQYCIYGIFEK